MAGDEDGTSAGGRPPGAARRRREPHDVRRDQILDAAEQVFVERGFASATIADVAEHAGVAKGTVYLYFDSKTQLLAALRARHVDRFKAALDDALDGPGRTKPLTRLDRFVDRFFEYSLGHRSLHHLLFHEAGFSEVDGFAAVRAQLTDFVARGMESGAFREGDTAALTDFLLAGIHASLFSALHADETRVPTIRAGAKEMSRRLLLPGTGP